MVLEQVQRFLNPRVLIGRPFPCQTNWGRGELNLHNYLLVQDEILFLDY